MELPKGNTREDFKNGFPNTTIKNYGTIICSRTSTSNSSPLTRLEKKPSIRMAKLQELETALTERVVIPYAKSPLTLQIYSFFSTFKISRG